MEDNRSSETAFVEFENRIARSRFFSNRIGLRRLPPGSALRLMVAVSLLIWAGLIVLFLHFFA